MAFNRGFDSTQTKSRRLLIEAAEALLEEEGQYAISARRIAERAGIKPQLVHYYFRTMDDLLVAVFNSAADQYLELHEAALDSAQPLHAIWQLNSHMPRTRRNMAFIALGTQHPGLRAEMQRSGEMFRAMQIEAVERVLRERGQAPDPILAPSLAMLMAAIARTTAMETQIGITLAHDEISRMVEAVLDRLEPGPAADQPDADANPPLGDGQHEVS
ncbi:MAG: TetR/AcrR family transcriptional regulator [Novosphingobium sp.]|nr:TetR/AcrR family transcriptional regulator [Novosphingobium sp.]